ncbi:hypothetical protein HPB50_020980 [Hyalomma asiaticum]|uniref:Uncharacterized protein n=1 Tax=Hyalomma asiaticum TaxID=266040 RepID=A0ACB7T673_HYAAI|nr:hypothetical protein HPB50_020980 [Hyalomma asiaticum]
MPHGAGDPKPKKSTRFKHEGTIHFERSRANPETMRGTGSSLSVVKATWKNHWNCISRGSASERSGHAAPSADAVLLPPPVLVARRDGGDGEESQRRRQRLIQSRRAPIRSGVSEGGEGLVGSPPSSWCPTAMQLAVLVRYTTMERRESSWVPSPAERWLREGSCSPYSKLGEGATFFLALFVDADDAAVTSSSSLNVDPPSHLSSWNRVYRYEDEKEAASGESKTAMRRRVVPATQF